MSILIVDESEPFAAALGHSLAVAGIAVWRAPTFRAASVIMDTLGPPSYIVSELRVDGRALVDFLNDVAPSLPPQRVVVATVYPSIATAVRLTRMGIAGYLTKPISAPDLLDVLEERPSSAVSSPQVPEPLTRPTLDRAIWEYISRTYADAGSISEAARRLGIERRSLRRMLAKHPPSR
jgi:two-component system response regulator RegA